MKKNLIIAFSAMLFACAWLTGCKKEVPQTIPADNADEMKAS